MKDIKGKIEEIFKEYVWWDDWRDEITPKLTTLINSIRKESVEGLKMKEIRKSDKGVCHPFYKSGFNDAVKEINEKIEVYLKSLEGKEELEINVGDEEHTVWKTPEEEEKDEDTFMQNGGADRW